VRGQELLDGLRQFALDQFGPLAKTVLNYWGVQRGEDFGEIVFNLVEVGILGKTDEDSRADFKGGYDFDVAFVKPFQPSIKKSSPRDPASSDVVPPRAAPATRGPGKKKLSSGPS
jgi:uncharacterized repeat protein (TIGR04138 family)